MEDTKSQRQILNNRILERILLLGDSEAQELLDTLQKPPVKFTIPRDILISLGYEKFRYSFSFLEDKYLLESKTEIKEDTFPSRGMRFEALRLGEWLLFDTEKGVLRYSTPRGEKRIKGVVNYSYLGRKDFAFHVTRDKGGCFLDENLRHVSSECVGSLEDKIDVRNAISIHPHLGFMLVYYRETNRTFRVQVVDKNFSTVVMGYNVDAACLLGDAGSLLVVVTAGQNSYLNIIEKGDTPEVLDRRRFEMVEDSYSLQALDHKKRLFLMVNNCYALITVWRFDGIFHKLQLIQAGSLDHVLNPGMFITDENELYKDISNGVGEPRFEVIQRFEGGVIETRFPSRKGLRRIAQQLSPFTALTSVDIVEVIVGFCLES